MRYSEIRERHDAIHAEFEGFIDERHFVLTHTKGAARADIAYDGCSTPVDYAVLAELIRLAKIGLEVDAGLSVLVPVKRVEESA